MRVFLQSQVELCQQLKVSIDWPTKLYWAPATHTPRGLANRTKVKNHFSALCRFGIMVHALCISSCPRSYLSAFPSFSIMVSLSIRRVGDRSSGWLLYVLLPWLTSMLYYWWYCVAGGIRIDLPLILLCFGLSKFLTKALCCH